MLARDPHVAATLPAPAVTTVCLGAGCELVTRRARRELASTLVKKPPKDALQLLHLVLVRSAEDGDEWDLACDLLGLTPSDEDGDFDKYEAFTSYTAGGDAELARAALAIAIAYFEEIELGCYRWREGAARYLQFLERHGYEISEAEKAKLAGVEKAATL
jgi:hypothetical protein